jgi:hypothetical protein
MLAAAANSWFKSHTVGFPPIKQPLPLEAAALAPGCPRKMGQKEQTFSCRTYMLRGIGRGYSSPADVRVTRASRAIRQVLSERAAFGMLPAALFALLPSCLNQPPPVDTRRLLIYPRTISRYSFNSSGNLLPAQRIAGPCRLFLAPSAPLSETTGWQTPV